MVVMKKKLHIMMSAMLLMMAGTMMTACSSDDDVSAIYHILDKNGQEVNVINYGDEMLFEVIVTNSSDQPLIFDDWRMIVNDAFIVYSSEGQMFNPIPNSNAMMRSVTIEPGEQYRNSLIWPWGSVPLSLGRYYSKYTLNIGNINKTYTVNFEIK